MADENKLEEVESQKHDEAAIDEIMQEVPESDEKPFGNVVQQPPAERGANRDVESSEASPSDTPASPVPPVPSAGESGHDEVTEVSEVELVKGGKLKSEAELEAELESIQPPKGAHPNVKKGISAMKDKLREELKAARAVVEEATKKAKESEEKLATIKPLDEQTEGELNSLREFKTVFAIEQEINSKYEPKITEASAKALGLLKQWGLPESVEKFITDNGGVVKMRYSAEMMPDGTQTQAEWFRKQILDNISSEAQKDALDDEVREARQLERAKNSEIKEAKGKPKEYLEARNKEMENANKDWETRAIATKDKLMKDLGDAAKTIEIKPDMSPEDKTKFEKHNDRITRGLKLYDDLLHNFAPETESFKAMSAAHSLYLSEYVTDLTEELKASNKERDELRERVGKMKNAGRTAKQSNAPIEAKKSIVPDIKLSDEQAIDKMFAEIDQKAQTK